MARNKTTRKDRPTPKNGNVENPYYPWDITTARFFCVFTEIFRGLNVWANVCTPCISDECGLREDRYPVSRILIPSPVGIFGQEQAPPNGPSLQSSRWQLRVPQALC